MRFHEDGKNVGGAVPGPRMKNGEGGTKWINSVGKVLPGLVARRDAQVALPIADVNNSV